MFCSAGRNRSAIAKDCTFPTSRTLNSNMTSYGRYKCIVDIYESIGIFIKNKFEIFGIGTLHQWSRSKFYNKFPAGN